MNRIISYFDLASAYRGDRARARAEGGERPFHWLPQYLGLLLGIAVQPYFQRYMATNHWGGPEIGGWFAASLVIAIMAFPGIYKATLDAGKPLFVQLCVIFTSGTGWQTLVSTALKAAGAAQ
jgi:hypothetical protein